MSRPSMHPEATAYLAAGLCVLPARRDEKRPTLRTWKEYQKHLPTLTEVDAWFANAVDAVCVLTGAVSGNAEMIDFDVLAELFEPWKAKVDAAAPELMQKLFIEKTQSDGRHVAYRCEVEVSGNLKLAQRKRLDDGKVITLIETRGEGGLFLCAPTPGYEVIQGDLCDLPILTETERDVLLRCAWELNEHVPDVVDGPRQPSNNAHTSSPVSSNGDRPGDDFNSRGDVRGVLEDHGWVCVKGGENEYWRRPGKTSGTSATLKDRVFYVFSSNAAPFEPDRAYAPFAVLTMLAHGGDFEQAARSLQLCGYGGNGVAHHNATDVDISALVRPCGPQEADNGPQLPDPGPIPAELLRIPGLISEVMDHCLKTAPYPNVPMAFCGALALQAFLAGRKVRDPGDNRTNIYLLGLAHSGVGKDWPRKINTDIIHRVGLADGLGDKFASGEGIQDALFATPCMLFQTDEIDGILQSINKAKDARHENIMSTMLTMYSSANSVFPMRRKAGKESPGVIDQPCLTIFGTAIPNHYYEALSERMLTNGFFARMLIVEAGKRGEGQEPSIRKPPPRVLATAKWWADFQPGNGNLENWHPEPAIVEQSDEAKRVLTGTRAEAEREYALAEEKNDPVGTTVWSRVSEQTRKLSLLYAVSENHESPRISLGAAQWATSIVLHQTRRMLYMAQSHVADNPFHAECLKLMRRLRKSGGQMARRELMRAMHWKMADFDQIVGTLITQGDIVPVEIPTRTKPAQGYRIA